MARETGEGLESAERLYNPVSDVVPQFAKGVYGLIRRLKRTWPGLGSGCEAPLRRYGKKGKNLQHPWQRLQLS